MVRSCHLIAEIMTWRHVFMKIVYLTHNLLIDIIYLLNYEVFVNVFVLLGLFNKSNYNVGVMRVEANLLVQPLYLFNKSNSNVGVMRVEANLPVQPLYHSIAKCYSVNSLK